MDARVGGLWRTKAFRQQAERLDGVLGEKTAKAFAGLGVHTVGDLLRHLPRRYLSGTELTDLSTIEVGEHVALMARVETAEVRHHRQTRGLTRGTEQSRLELRLTDGRGTLNATFFGRDRIIEWWKRQLVPGARGIFVGKVGAFRGELQMAHPAFVILDERGRVLGSSDDGERIAELSRSGLVPIYPASSALKTWVISECVRLTLPLLDADDDPWPDWVREGASVPTLLDAFTFVHRPTSESDVEAGQRRLLFDEAFATQLTMAYRRDAAARQGAGARVRRPGGILDAFDAACPFELTAGQVAVSEEIFADLARTRPMQRLLQGEVGSGKTVVALRAMLATVDAGGQAALLAPTEVLASQHVTSIRALLGPLGEGSLLGASDATEVVLLTGSTPAAARRDALARIASGQAGIVVGTHALLAEGIAFADLGLVVVDEQHRFGVEQRAALTDRSLVRPHVLVLTATPIPRSVAMTIFGDLEVSTLSEVPGGRGDVATNVVDGNSRPAWVDRAWQRVREEVESGGQVFVVAPRIHPSKDELRRGEPRGGVVQLAEELSGGALAGLRIATLHSQVPAEAKQAVMAGFANGEIDVLVATTMIEVGVDVPNATMMVIWDADRFGISQLHQLRGRVGRGSRPALCLLVSHAEPEASSWDRLRAVASTRDGFALADLDLAQRREGDVLGATQSGSRSSLRFLRVLEHGEIIGLARELAEEAVRRDASCETPGFADALTLVGLFHDSDYLERA